MDKEVEAKLLFLEAKIKLILSDSYYWQAVALAARDTAILLESKLNQKDFEEVRGEMEKRRRWWHQKLLEETENTSPRLAAELDDRPPEEIP